ncbi:MAG: hypothetical protein Q9204_005250 [Flavoplaca sp. TL-2023a]
MQQSTLLPDSRLVPPAPLFHLGQPLCPILQDLATKFSLISAALGKVQSFESPKPLAADEFDRGPAKLTSATTLPARLQEYASNRTAHERKDNAWDSQLTVADMANNHVWDDDYERRYFSTVLLVIYTFVAPLATFYQNYFDNSPYTTSGFIIGTIIEAGVILALIIPIQMLLGRLYSYNPFWLPWLLKPDRYGYHWYPDVANWLGARGYAMNQAPIILEETEGPAVWRTAHVSDTNIMARKLWQEMLSRDM